MPLREGISRAKNAAQNATMRIAMFDQQWHENDYNADIILLNKCDLSADKNRANIDNMFYISTKTGQGLDDFMIYLSSVITEKLKTHNAAPRLTRKRHRDLLIAAHTDLTRAANAKLPELAAEDMRLSIRNLGRITGRVDVEDILDVVFNDFCIGK